MMNHMAEGLISFLSAHGTLEDERRLMGRGELTVTLLFIWPVHTWLESSVPQKNMSPSPSSF